jgi:hypothetical protein
MIWKWYEIAALSGSRPKAPGSAGGYLPIRGPLADSVVLCGILLQVLHGQGRLSRLKRPLPVPPLCVYFPEVGA